MSVHFVCILRYVATDWRSMQRKDAVCPVYENTGQPIRKQDFLLCNSCYTWGHLCVKVRDSQQVDLSARARSIHTHTRTHAYTHSLSLTVGHSLSLCLSVSVTLIGCRQGVRAWDRQKGKGEERERKWMSVVSLCCLLDWFSPTNQQTHTHTQCTCSSEPSVLRRWLSQHCPKV